MCFNLIGLIWFALSNYWMGYFSVVRKVEMRVNSPDQNIIFALSWVRIRASNSPFVASIWL